jgi:hypothetical protein
MSDPLARDTSTPLDSSSPAHLPSFEERHQGAKEGDLRRLVAVIASRFAHPGR